MTTIFDIMRLKSLAAVGDVEAMYTLGCNYLYGVGVEADIVKAYSYFNKAVDKGFEPAKGLMEAVFADKGESASLASEFKEDIYEAFKTMCQEADKGDPGALHLKSMARLSDDTDDFRFKRAVREQELACKQNYVPALFFLGVCIPQRESY